MKNILKKLHIGGGSHSEESDGSKSGMGRHSDGSGHKSRGGSPSPSGSPGSSEQKPFSALSGWLNSVSRHSSSSAPQFSPSASSVGSSSKGRLETYGSGPATPSGSFEILHTEPGVREVYSQDPAAEEEYQIRLAMELSAKDDPEAVQIEAVKQMSLCTTTSSQNAEVTAYRYWNYNSLDYDEKIVDGFYDLYGVVRESSSEKMPSLVDLQSTRVSDNISCEVVLVNRATDPELVSLEKKAFDLAVESRHHSWDLSDRGLVYKIATLVSDSMGGPVGDPNSMLKQWRAISESLRSSLKSIVLPLGCLKVGLSRHRALLFKVLADSIGIPCRLVKGRESRDFIGTDEAAVNIIKVQGEREYILDLMGAPGTLIPSDVTGTIMPQVEFEEISSRFGPGKSSASGTFKDVQGVSSFEKTERSSKHKFSAAPSELTEKKSVLEQDEFFDIVQPKRISPRGSGSSSSSYSHTRTPSWTEGIGSPAVRRMKVKDVSQYMMDAAKENPGLAQKLHDVLLESGVVAPPNLFTEIPSKQLDVKVAEGRKMVEDRIAKKKKKSLTRRVNKGGSFEGYLPPPVPQHTVGPRDKCSKEPLQRLSSVKGLGERRPLEMDSISIVSSPISTSTAESSALAQESISSDLIKHVPVAAAAAATAAVVASSMVVAASKANSDHSLEVPVAAAATATAAVVVATTAAVGKKYELSDSGPAATNEAIILQDNKPKEEEGLGKAEHENVPIPENDSPRPAVMLDDVAEWEIPWEDITLGERIGLGSYGEVYRGEWHRTEVAVKKFLDQDISGDALEEFRSEVRIMKRLRHPNVVLFMGAVTRAPNLSIVTEFLPRGSLYRLIHRPNNQLDEKKRLRMALDVARGMNYLHSSNPVIVHRDLKSPNLLVDRNWVVKVCDFGLSRMKHNTYISSRSTAGTAEWMAPEVLRNEPSNEKCDVFSFGVILWELATLQQPWGGMNPMQVVGAVGFQHRRLELPDGMDPVIADIISRCWNNDPKLRPSFAEIMEALKPLQRAARQNAPVNKSVPNVQMPQREETNAGQ